MYEFTHSPVHAPQIDKGVCQKLSWSVEGHLTAAVALHHWNLPRREHVFEPPRLSKGEHLGMLDQPELILNHFIPQTRELAHCFDYHTIRLHAEMAYSKHPDRNPGGSCRTLESLSLHWPSGDTGLLEKQPD